MFKEESLKFEKVCGIDLSSGENTEGQKTVVYSFEDGDYYEEPFLDYFSRYVSEFDRFEKEIDVLKNEKLIIQTKLRLISIELLALVLIFFIVCCNI